MTNGATSILIKLYCMVVPLIYKPGRCTTPHHTASRITPWRPIQTNVVDIMCIGPKSSLDFWLFSCRYIDIPVKCSTFRNRQFQIYFTDFLYSDSKFIEVYLTNGLTGNNINIRSAKGSIQSMRQVITLTNSSTVIYAIWCHRPTMN